MKTLGLLLALIVTGSVLHVGLAAGDGPDCVPAAELSVIACGAVPDDGISDKSAINDAIERVHDFGGGRVVFPAGVYHAAGIRHRSHVELYGGSQATVVRDGADRVIEGEVVDVSGSIARGSRTLTVSDAAAFEPGARVAIRGAGGRSTVQRRSLAWPVLSGGSPFILRSPNSGWSTRPGNDGYLIVDNEIIRYDMIDEESGMVGGVVRGRLGTAISRHQAGKQVHQSQVHYANIVSVVGKKVTLDQPASFGVKNAAVWVGAQDMRVTGLIVDGARPVSANDPTAVSYSLARFVTITGSTIRNGHHGAISLNKGTADSVIENNVLIDNGDPDGASGAVIWLFQGAVGNTVRSNWIGDGDDPVASGSNDGLTIDDRSVEASEWDRASSKNLIENNTIRIGRTPKTSNTGMLLSGATNNSIVGNAIAPTEGATDAATFGINLKTTGQGHYPIAVTGNVIRFNELYNHATGIRVLKQSKYNNLTNNVLFDTATPCVVETPAPGNSFTGTTHNGEQVVCVEP